MESLCIPYTPNKLRHLLLLFPSISLFTTACYLTQTRARGIFGDHLPIIGTTLAWLLSWCAIFILAVLILGTVWSFIYSLSHSREIVLDDQGISYPRNLWSSKIIVSVI